jgi:hypothetical protein
MVRTIVDAVAGVARETRGAARGLADAVAALT